MPDPRLATIAESSLTDIETTADAWHLPPSYFAIPISPTSPRAGNRTPPSPGSPYPCHVSSPLAHSFAENLSRNDVSNATTGTGFKCDSPCIEGIACRFHNTEHPFNRRRKSSMPPSGVWTPIVDVKEIVAGEAEKKAPPAPASLWSPPAEPSSPTKPHLHPLLAINTGTTSSSTSSSPAHVSFASGIVEPPSTATTSTATTATIADAIESINSVAIAPTAPAQDLGQELKKQRRAERARAIPLADPQGGELLYEEGQKLRRINSDGLVPSTTAQSRNPEIENEERILAAEDEEIENQRRAEWARATLLADPQGSELLYEEGWRLGERWLLLL